MKRPRPAKKTRKQLPDYVLLAAGKGTRLWPITEDTPKVMIRVMGKPIIEWMVEWIAGQANRIVVVVGDGKEKVIKHFGKTPYRAKMFFTHQEKQLGTGHALLRAERFVSNDFVVLNADTFFDPAVFSLLRKKAVPGSYFTMAKTVPDASKYGVFSVKAGAVTGLVEKPPEAGEGLVNTGLFHLPHGFFSYLHGLKPSPRGEYELTDAILEFAKKERLKAIVFKEYWNDTGYFWNYLDASAFALDRLMRPKVLGKMEKGVHVKGRIFVGRGSVIKSGTYIEGPAWIGKNCVIGPRAYLRPHSAIEDECHVGNSTEVKNSIILRGSNAAHLSYLGDSIVCEEANLGAGTILSNLRFDESPVKVTIKGARVVSEKKKLGCVIGRGTKTGANVVVNPGILIGSNCRIYPGAVVSKNAESGSVVVR